jgi:proteasome lid subunit RPN8/RPN11
MKGRKVSGIARDTLDFILEASRSSMPHEFAGLLQASKGIITEVLILPGTESSRMSALVRLYMLPNVHMVGSIHSHPSSHLRPSKEDLIFFTRTGDYHIIAGPPFDRTSWVCYDAMGARRDLPILNVKFKDDGFDDLEFDDVDFDDKEAGP